MDAPYREEDRTTMIAKTIARFGDDGAQVFEDATNYVAGLNQYVAMPAACCRCRWNTWRWASTGTFRD